MSISIKTEEVRDIQKQAYNKALEDVKLKIDDEYYDGGYGDYHEVAMIVRMIEEMEIK